MKSLLCFTRDANDPAGLNGGSSGAHQMRSSRVADKVYQRNWRPFHLNQPVDKFPSYFIQF